MIHPLQNSYNQLVFSDSHTGIQLCIKREDVLHPEISGNKFRKLKYNLAAARETNQKTLLTFGGAYSNHIAAVAAAGREYGFTTIGVIRGDELASKFLDNPTLRRASEKGMQFEFITRTQYRNKEDLSFLEQLYEKWGDFYLIPEGGTNALAVQGCEEILTDADKAFHFICCAVGTGGTISGLINSSYNHQKVIGFPVLKGDFLANDIRNYTHNNRWHLITDYHFGGYAKTSSQLNSFIRSFESKYLIPLEPVYTGKVLYGIFDLISKNYFPENSKILVIHTGGLQGLQSNLLK